MMYDYVLFFLGFLSKSQFVAMVCHPTVVSSLFRRLFVGFLWGTLGYCTWGFFSRTKLARPSGLKRGCL